MAPRDLFPAVYPSKVKYRPGRVQTLSPDQEIILKQCWATLLKYWGYDVSLQLSDVANALAFCVSSIVTQFAPNSNDLQSVKLAAVKKKSVFSKKQPPKLAPISTQRSKLLGSPQKEVYDEELEVSNHTRHVFCDVYKQRFCEDAGTGDSSGSASDGDLDDVSSCESFFSAYSTITDYTPSHTIQSTEQFKNEPVSVISHHAVQCTKQFKPKDLHHSFFGFMKNDLIDNYVLRYIRARKGDYERTMEMLVNTLDWKLNQYPVEEWLRQGDAPSFVSGKNRGFVKNFTVGKCFIGGHDRNKNPLFVFQSSKHFARDSPLEETERFALVVIEWCRLFLRDVSESVDTCSLMFDLSGFTLKNADNAPIKFLISMFEAHYPESLGVILVHNPPWIFSTVWNVIKPWLDPVVASKIHFTKGYDQLKEHIDPLNIPEYLGGQYEADLKYPSPSKEHTVPIKEKDEEYVHITKERDDLILRLIQVTIKWVESVNPEVSSAYLRERIHLECELSSNYVKLDPYLRNPGVYDRNGSLKMCQ